VTGALAIAALLALVPATGVAQGNSGAPATPPQKEETRVEALQERMEAQPEVMDTIRRLQSDPQFQDVLDDPEIVKALGSGDIAALLANPKVNNLINHPAVQDITKKLAQ